MKNNKHNHTKLLPSRRNNCSYFNQFKGTCLFISAQCRPLPPVALYCLTKTIFTNTKMFQRLQDTENIVISLLAKMEYNKVSKN